MVRASSSTTSRVPRRTPRFSTSCRRSSSPAASRSITTSGDPARSFDLWPLFERPRPVHVVLLRAAAAVAGDSRHVRPLVRIRDPHRELRRCRNARGPGRSPFRVRLATSGDTVEVGAHQSILEALREHGLDVPSSCESGTCGTCRTRLLGGVADHRDLVLIRRRAGRQHHGVRVAGALAGNRHRSTA